MIQLLTSGQIIVNANQSISESIYHAQRRNMSNFTLRGFAKPVSILLANGSCKARKGQMKATKALITAIVNSKDIQVQGSAHCCFLFKFEELVCFLGR